MIWINFFYHISALKNVSIWGELPNNINIGCQRGTRGRTTCWKSSRSSTNSQACRSFTWWESQAEPASSSKISMAPNSRLLSATSSNALATSSITSTVSTLFTYSHISSTSPTITPYYLSIITTIKSLGTLLPIGAFTKTKFPTFSNTSR